MNFKDSVHSYALGLARRQAMNIAEESRLPRSFSKWGY